MSIVVGQAPADEIARDERSAHRLSGLVIALGASFVLWVAIGAGVWGLVSLAG